MRTPMVAIAIAGRVHSFWLSVSPVKNTAKPLKFELCFFFLEYSDTMNSENILGQKRNAAYKN